jgi:hypothetical protein
MLKLTSLLEVVFLEKQIKSQHDTEVEDFPGYTKDDMWTLLRPVEVGGTGSYKLIFCRYISREILGAAFSFSCPPVQHTN